MTRCDNPSWRSWREVSRPSPVLLPVMMATWSVSWMSLGRGLGFVNWRWKNPRIVPSERALLWRFEDMFGTELRLQARAGSNNAGEFYNRG